MQVKLFGFLFVFAILTTSVHAQSVSNTETLDPQTSITSSFDPLNTEDVEAKVRKDFADIPVLIKIAQCESGFRQFDSAGNPLYGGSGGMVGVFQFAAAIHNDTAKDLSFDINTLDGNLSYARYVFEKEGIVPWLASASCWNPQKITTLLQQGSKGGQVKALQVMLNQIGYTIANTGEGSPGKESTVFGTQTKEAVKRFQCDIGITCSGNEKTSGFGLVGVKTRVALLKAASKMTRVETSASLTLK